MSEQKAKGGKQPMGPYVPTAAPDDLKGAVERMRRLAEKMRGSDGD